MRVAYEAARRTRWINIVGQFKTLSVSAPHPRIVRYDELRPCFDAFIDTRTPGSDKKENFTIIGPGVSENPNQYVHIAEPHGFNIGGARQPPGCVNSQHSHDTAEVFFVHHGTWSFDLGEHAADANITLRAGDLISIPTKLFRGFKNIGKDVGYLWAILGQDDPGRVTWAPDVFDMAKHYGLVLLENGSLIDTAKGETIPEGARAMPVTSREDIAQLQTFTNSELRKCCILRDQAVATIEDQGVSVRALIGPMTDLNWAHGFSVAQVDMAVGGETLQDTQTVSDVIFVHEGVLSIKVDDEIWTLSPGDTATIPAGAQRQFHNHSGDKVSFLRVLGDV